MGKKQEWGVQGVGVAMSLLLQKSSFIHGLQLLRLEPAGSEN